MSSVVTDNGDYGSEDGDDFCSAISTAYNFRCAGKDNEGANSQSELPPPNFRGRHRRHDYRLL